MTDQLERVKSALEIVRYRPGWTITAHPCPVGNHAWVLIDGEVPDAERWDHDLPAWRNRSRDNMTRIAVRAVVPCFTELEQFYDWLAWRLKRVDRHESREFFWVGPGPWDSPHKVPQPPHDYLVRKVGSTLPWRVRHFGGGTDLGAFETWRSAYQHAWQCAILDDLAKGEDMING